MSAISNFKLQDTWWWSKIFTNFMGNSIFTVINFPYWVTTKYFEQGSTRWPNPLVLHQSHFLPFHIPNPKKCSCSTWGLFTTFALCTTCTVVGQSNPLYSFPFAWLLTLKLMEPQCLKLPLQHCGPIIIEGGWSKIPLYVFTFDWFLTLQWMEPHMIKVSARHIHACV